MTSNDSIVTIADANTLADLIRAIQAGSAFDWYQWGTDTDKPTRRTLRALTDEHGNFLLSGSDVMSTHVWSSGIMEWFTPIRDILRAMQNSVDGCHGQTNPMMIVRSE